jgi:hypothetical protein
MECGVPFTWEQAEKHSYHVSASRKGTKNKIDYTRGLNKILYLTGKIIGHIENKLIDTSPTYNKENTTHIDRYGKGRFWAG